MQTSTTLTVTPRSAAWFLGEIIAFIICMNLVVLLVAHLGHPRLAGLSHLFIMDAENNLPTLAACVYWLLAATLAFLVARVQRSHGVPDLRWLGLGLIMSFIALDEFAQLHEQLAEPMRKLLGYREFYVAWIVPVGILTSIVAAFYARLVFSLPKRTRRLFIGSGVVFVAGAACFEALGNWLVLHTTSTVPYELCAICEETLEMLGVTMLVCSLIAYFEDTHQAVDVQIGQRNPHP